MQNFLTVTFYGGINMRRVIALLKVMVVLLMSIFALSCTDAKCLVDRQLCQWDCPSTIGMKQACEQKCNLLYDLCRNKVTK